MSGPKPPHAFIAPGRQKRKRNLDDFASSLQTTVHKALPTISKNYRRVAVLSLSWSNDTIDIKTTERELLDVFQKYNYLITYFSFYPVAGYCYGFVVERFVIPADSGVLHAWLELQTRINGFIRKWDSEDSLTIYIYSGHGVSATRGMFLQYLIAGQSDRDGIVGPCLDWFACSGNIKLLLGDALYIIDSCYSTTLALEDGPELLAAANWSSVAESVHNTSFTRMLAAQLKELDDSPCSVSHLFGKLHRFALDNNITQAPVYVAHPTKDSIVLQRLEKPAKVRQSRRMKKLGMTRQSKRTKDLQIEALKDSESRALIAVHLQHTTEASNFLNWKNWVAKNIPPSVDPSQITIEGHFDANSSLILVALPVAIWAALPEDDNSYGFVSFVQSGNHLLNQPGP